MLLETGFPDRQAEAREYAWIERGFSFNYPLTSGVRRRRGRPNSHDKAILPAVPGSGATGEYDRNGSHPTEPILANGNGQPRGMKTRSEREG